ncbi:putative YigZ family protein [Streptohalobacillus salinus]|uniref:Putative YigZ family protein n=1 Tax=Streptohalobacillus salinus TaxID=621096 RepID=A0A2V3WDL0_9BACI|nr:YigZ family protein [Streptohalobacillus salinus]PXW92996.1 putative YigZ family protein [Streptohalobacillus salinus]
MLKHYLTVKNNGQAEIEIQKSRFIGHVKRCETEEAAKTFIDEIKKNHRQANHNCSAYVIGERDHIQRAHDDGEPSGTAGVPILDVIKKQGLKDTCVVITRYFGGIKLGAGGLIRAYSEATSTAIRATGVVSRKWVEEMIVTVDYGLLGKIEHALIDSDYLLDTIDYLANVTLHIYVEADQINRFKTWLTDLTHDQLTIEQGSAVYLETPVSNG